MSFFFFLIDKSFEIEASSGICNKCFLLNIYFLLYVRCLLQLIGHQFSEGSITRRISLTLVHLQRARCTPLTKYIYSFHNYNQIIKGIHFPEVYSGAVIHFNPVHWVHSHLWVFFGNTSSITYIYSYLYLHCKQLLACQRTHKKKVPISPEAVCLQQTTLFSVLQWLSAKSLLTWLFSFSLCHLSYPRDMASSQAMTATNSLAPSGISTGAPSISLG